jgi:hypothetical protein
MSLTRSDRPGSRSSSSLAAATVQPTRPFGWPAVPDIAMIVLRWSAVTVSFDGIAARPRDRSTRGPIHRRGTISRRRIARRSHRAPCRASSCRRMDVRCTRRCRRILQARAPQPRRPRTGGGRLPRRDDAKSRPSRAKENHSWLARPRTGADARATARPADPALVVARLRLVGRAARARMIGAGNEVEAERLRADDRGDWSGTRCGRGRDAQTDAHLAHGRHVSPFVRSSWVAAARFRNRLLASVSPAERRTATATNRRRVPLHSTLFCSASKAATSRRGLAAPSEHTQSRRGRCSAYPREHESRVDQRWGQETRDSPNSGR